MTPDDATASLSEPTRAWLARAFPGGPTPAQRGAWPAIASGEHALIVAPTGSGKTLAAFLAGIDALLALPPDAPEGTRVLYVSPLKALVVDVRRNLEAPLAGLAGAGQRPIRAELRTGDTPQRARAAQRKHPADILVTTPESLYLLLTGAAADTLREVRAVIVDEVHVLAGTRRGVHLQLSLERLVELTGREVQRIGLSATIEPLDVATRFLAGDRPVRVVDARAAPRMDLRIEVPVDDMEHPPLPGLVDEPATGVFQYPTNQPRGGMWPALHPVLLDHIRSHTSTILFANSRLLCERLCRALNELAGEELVRAHHGSVSHEQRAALEEDLKAGRLPAIVATSSLELGIDMGAVDLVLLVESPGSAARGLQRVGRAGHHVGGTSAGRILPKHRGDLLEATVIAGHMLRGEIEPTALPGACLDVLAQQVTAMVAMADQPVDALLAVVRRAASYRDLSRPLLDAVLDMLSGRYASDALSELRPTIVWDRETDVLRARRGARLLAVLNGGTIPDRGLYRVRAGPDGPRVGELDEEMVFESRTGDHIVLGATTWRVDEIRRDEVIVSPAPGRGGRLPFWHGDKPGRPVPLGRALGAFVRELATQADPEAWLRAGWPLDARAARNLAAYVHDQREATGRAPDDRCVVIERFRDELGDWRVCLLSPFGGRVHTPWAMAIEVLLLRQTGAALQATAGDDGISLRLADGDALPLAAALLPDPDEVEELLLEGVRRSALFAARFREAAARALLLPRRTPRGRQPLWMQRRRAEALQATVADHPSFPIVLETYRELLQDVFDLAALVELLRGIRARVIEVHEVTTRRPSPFARGLVFQYVSAWLYEGDQPLAERRAAALALDRDLLAELVGSDDVRALLDPEAIAEVEQELQGLAPDARIEHADALHDLLRRVGDLRDDEIADRCAVSPGPLLDALRGRALRVTVAGEPRWIAVEDAARYRDALGVVLPPLPDAWTGPAEGAVASLTRRWARTRGPFLDVHLAARFGWTRGQAEAALTLLERDGHVVREALRRGGPEWCDPEVLRRIKRRTLARLRREIEPVGPELLAELLPVWQGVGGDAGGPDRLREVLAQLEGLPMPASELEARVLPARVRGYQPFMLDQLGAMGEVVWVGRGALGARDGMVALYRRESAAALLPEPAAVEPGPLHRRLLDALERRGACFSVELLAGADAAEATACLWDLVWWGLVTNDTLQPLRALTDGGRVAGGRWSLVAPLRDPATPDTARRVAQARALLDRYGVVARPMAAAEEASWAALYPVLAAMEDAGRARRGWFVEGLGGVQLALPGAIDRLRALRGGERVVRWMSAVDPACAWGAALPWPEPPRPEARPRRLAGAQVATVGGRPTLWLAPSGRALTLLAGAYEGDDLARAVAALREALGYRSLSVDRVDGLPARDHPEVARLLAAGFQRDFKGLVLTRATG